MIFDVSSYCIKKKVHLKRGGFKPISSNEHAVRAHNIEYNKTV